MSSRRGPAASSGRASGQSTLVAPGRAAHSHPAPAPGALPDAVDIYDTTLRDGSQQEGLSLTVDDKLRVAEQLDHLGVAYIEGGWPGSNPKDEEFFARAPTELTLATATLVAFGSTRRPGGQADTDPTLRHLVEAGTEAVCIVAKAWDFHVTEALRTTLSEARAMAADSVAWLAGQGRRVFFDAEHFFDGYRSDPGFTLSVLEAAAGAGAETLVLCDTNGGTLPHEVEAVVGAVRAAFPGIQLGLHFHNDSGCAVANTLAGVRAGATQVQGCVNGYGERAGNADLSAAIPNLALKMGVRAIPPDRLERLTPVAHHLAELVNVPPGPQQPYVGTSAFAHKAGLHASAIARAPSAYEHVPPDSVGNGTRFVVSELAGRSTLALKAAELGLELDGPALSEVLDHLKVLEHAGYHFEVADGSLELLMRTAAGWRQELFALESYRVIVEHRPGARSGSGSRSGPGGSGSDAGSGAGSGSGELMTEATVKVHVGEERVVATAEGNGPVNALDAALRAAIGPRFEALSGLHLTDYRVRVLDSRTGTRAVTRVLLDTTDGTRSWSTIGVSENVIQASWQALADSVVYGLLASAAPAGPAGGGAPAGAAGIGPAGPGSAGAVPSPATG
ncbi:MAG: citramalate synthase [Acidimicrobiales bacterium]